MNLCRKFSLPCKLCSSRTIFGEGNWIIASTFSGSTMILNLETMKPTNHPDMTQKMHLCGFRWIFYFGHRSKIAQRWSRCLSLFLEFFHQFVDSRRSSNAIWEVKNARENKSLVNLNKNQKLRLL